MAEELSQINEIFKNAQLPGGGGDGTNMVSQSKTKSGQTFDIYKCDYPWVDKCDDKREMRLAYECMKADGGFPDLTNYCLKKLKNLDRNYKTEEDFNNCTPEEARAANDDVLSFLSDMKKADLKLKQEERSDQIFD